MSTTTQVSTEIATPKELMEANKARSEKIKTATDNLIALADQGMNDEIDQKMVKHIDAFGKAWSEMNESRMPLTRKMNEVIKVFTTAENSVKENIADLQKKRNVYAAQKKKDADELRKKSETELAKKTEAVNLNAAIELEIRKHVNDKIDVLKKAILRAMEEVTVENFEVKHKRLKAMPVEVPPTLFTDFATSQKSYLGNDVAGCVKSLIEKLSPELKKHYLEQIGEMKDGALNVMNEMSKMSPEEKANWKKSASETIATEVAISNEIAEQKVEIAKEAATTAVVIDHVVAEIPEVNVKQSYEIVVDAKEAYASIAAFWMSKFLPRFDGNILTKNIGSMIKDIEKHSNGTGEFLQVAGIRYVEVIKAK